MERKGGDRNGKGEEGKLIEIGKRLVGKGMGEGKKRMGDREKGKRVI